MKFFTALAAFVGLAAARAVDRVERRHCDAVTSWSTSYTTITLPPVTSYTTITLPGVTETSYTTIATTLATTQTIDVPVPTQTVTVPGGTTVVTDITVIIATLVKTVTEVETLIRADLKIIGRYLSSQESEQR